MVFTLAQFFLSDILSGRNDALDRLNQQVAELAEVLALEKKSNKQLREDLAQISLELEKEKLLLIFFSNPLQYLDIFIQYIPLIFSLI